MSNEEYTPTTDEVRTAWGFFGNDTVDWENPEKHAVAHAEFDRWLNEQLAEAWDACVDTASDMISDRKVGELRWLNPHRPEES